MILQQYVQNRLQFDPSNQEHKSAYKIFLNTGRWTMSFHCEHPHSSVVTTVERKLIEFSLRDVSQTADLVSMQILQDRKIRKQKGTRIGGDEISLIGPADMPTCHGSIISE